jgi:hypothetical protein
MRQVRTTIARSVTAIHNLKFAAMTVELTLRCARHIFIEIGLKGFALAGNSESLTASVVIRG